MFGRRTRAARSPIPRSSDAIGPLDGKPASHRGGLLLRLHKAPSAASTNALAGNVDKLKEQGKEPDEKLRAEIDRVRAEYELQLDARFAAARGFVDAVIGTPSPSE